MKTKQELFNNVWQYFIVEKHPKAANPNTAPYYATCLYRGPESNCAVGCQLPDELYRVEMDYGSSIDAVMHTYPEVRDYFGLESAPFLTGLQRAHDLHFPTLEHTLREIASANSLTIPDAN